MFLISTSVVLFQLSVQVEAIEDLDSEPLTYKKVGNGQPMLWVFKLTQHVEVCYRMGLLLLEVVLIGISCLYCWSSLFQWDIDGEDQRSKEVREDGLHTTFITELCIFLFVCSLCLCTLATFGCFVQNTSLCNDVISQYNTKCRHEAQKKKLNSQITLLRLLWKQAFLGHVFWFYMLPVFFAVANFLYVYLLSC